jgi:hypothetical protein
LLPNGDGGLRPFIFSDFVAGKVFLAEVGWGGPENI